MRRSLGEDGRLVAIRQREAGHMPAWPVPKGLVKQLERSGHLPAIVVVQAAEDRMGDDLSVERERLRGQGMDCVMPWWGRARLK